MIGTFTAGGNLEKGQEVQFLGVRAVVVEENENDSNESTKQVDEGLELEIIEFIFIDVQLPSELARTSVTYDVPIGLGAGVEFIESFLLWGLILD